MENLTRDLNDLTPQQQTALAELKQCPVPEPPALEANFLREPPVGYQLLSGKGLLAAGLLLLAAAWQGTLLLRSGASIALMEGKSETIRLPRENGTLLLYGPARLEMRRLSRHLITGRIEGELLLEEGDLLLSAASHAPKQIWIKTPLLQIRVTGTQLLVGHRASQGSRLFLWEGTVRVKPAGKPWRSLPAGMAFTVTPQGAVAQESLTGFTARPSPQGPGGSSEAIPQQPQLKEFIRLLWHEQD